MISEVRAVVFDWAGTMVDFGSFAPMQSFVAAFEAFGVSVTLEEARGPMGLPKRDHIDIMIHQPRIAEVWEQVNGAPPGSSDVDAILARFEPINAQVAARHADLVPGALDMLAELNRRGIKVGSTTG
ncbi:MAG: phosphonoacetaldehyde hydrolase, partial [Alphaproteobacteria bacterium TMED89]